MKKIILSSLIAFNMMISTSFAGVIVFDNSYGGLTNFSETISGTSTTAVFDNPFSEQGTNAFYTEGSFLIIGSGGLTLSWDVTFSDTVFMTSIDIGDPVIINRGFNIVGLGVNLSNLLSGLNAGSHSVGNIQFLANETYTFSSVSRNITAPITGSGGIRFGSLNFSEDIVDVPAPGTLAFLSIGLIGFALRRKIQK